MAGPSECPVLGPILTQFRRGGPARGARSLPDINQRMILGRKLVERCNDQAFQVRKGCGQQNQGLSAPGAGYREIGIAAVAAAVRCQHMAGPDDERPADRTHNPARTDRLP